MKPFAVFRCLVFALVGLTASRATDSVLLLGGADNLYYPVFFRDDERERGAFELNIHRGNLHTDGLGYGSMLVELRSHSSQWGHGSDFLESDVHWSGSYGTVIAGAVRTFYAAGVVVWLRGARTYFYNSNHALGVVENSASGAELVTYENSLYNVREAFQVKTEADPSFELHGRSSEHNLRIGGLLSVAGNVGIGTSDPVAKLDVVGTLRLDSQTTQNSYFATISPRYDSSHPFSIGVENNTGGTAGEVFGVYSPWGGGYLNLALGLNGNVGIGTTSPTHKLAVNGAVRAKEVIVDTGWSDYVFAPDYRLAPLAEVEAHIKAKQHLPGMPSAAEVAEQGVSVGDMQAKLLAKIEELTLHQIRQEKEIEKLKLQNAELQTRRNQ